MSNEAERDHAAELLAMDYEHFADSYWKSEQIGETRVNWFIGVVTASLGGLAYLAGSTADGLTLRVVMVATLLGLAFFGLLTLWRIFKRNASSTGYIEGLRAIRRIYKAKFDPGGALEDYRPLARRRGDSAPRRRFGGLAHLVAGIVALLVGAAVCGAAYPVEGRGTRVLLALVASVAAAGGAYAWLHGRVERSEKVIESMKFTHAGGVVYRGQGEGVEYLLARARGSAAEWVLPKGHIEEGETAEEAALREVREETGAVCRVVAPAGELRFTIEKEGRKEEVRAEYYLMRWTGSVKPVEERELKWSGFDEAVGLLSFDDSKKLLGRAEELRRRLKARGRA